MKTKSTKLVTLDTIGLTKESVPDMLDIVKGQISQITKGLPKSNKTSNAPDGFPLSVSQCNTVEDLIKMHSFIVAKENAYKTSVKALGLTESNYPSKISGFGAKTWINDITFRLNEVKNKTKLEKLNKVKNLLENNLSEEAKFAKEMGDMVGILKDLKVD